LWLAPIAEAAQELQWTPIPLRTKAMADAGIFGGEGCQWPQALVCDVVDGSFMLYATDVGGIFRSTNGGEMWEAANIGHTSRGASDFAIDPVNNHRALSIGCDGKPGVYLTTDRAATWTQTLSADQGTYHDPRHHEVVYDKSSYDPVAKYCKIAYWSSKDKAANLFKTTDGGSTWNVINDAPIHIVVSRFIPSKGMYMLPNRARDSSQRVPMGEKPSGRSRRAIAPAWM
jgi:hypothetical protein